MTEPNFYFNPKTGRYHYADGPRKYEFIGANKLRELVKEYYDARKEDAREINQRLFKSEITVGQWEKEQAGLIKTLAVQSYKLGNPALGSDPQNDRSDYGKVGRKLRDEYLYLRNFSREIIGGRLSEAQINARIEMYVDANMWAFEEGKRESFKRSGWTWERRRLSPVKEHCSSCPRYAALGWQPISTLPAITTRCECRARDKCYFEYSKSVSRPTDSVKGKIMTSNGWLK